MTLFEALAAEQSGSPAQATFEDFADFARRHQVIIERFGRFPHRNAILGRTSTPEEAGCCSNRAPVSKTRHIKIPAR